jgi:hypothetical protein
MEKKKCGDLTEARELLWERYVDGPRTYDTSAVQVIISLLLMEGEPTALVSDSEGVKDGWCQSLTFSPQGLDVAFSNWGLIFASVKGQKIFELEFEDGVPVWAIYI